MNNKSFKYKYTSVTFFLLILVTILTALGIGVNIYNIIAYKDEVVKIITYSIVVLLVLFVLCLDISMIIFSRYVIKDGKLYSYFGFVSNKKNIEDITEIVLFKSQNKLVTYFADNSYSVIVISPSDYNNFVDSIREINGKIIYRIDDNNLVKEKVKK